MGLEQRSYSILVVSASENFNTSLFSLLAESGGCRPHTVENINSAKRALAERDQQISDLNAQIAELQNNPGQEPQAGAAPANNGGGAEAAGVAISTQYVMDPNMSYEENMKAKKEWEAAHK